jgi:arginyl-tRNA synthetase
MNNILPLIKNLFKVACERQNITGAVINLKPTTHESHGDLTTNIALTTNAGNARQLAQALVDDITSNPASATIIERIEVAGPGFINVTLSNQIYIQQLREIIAQGDEYVLTPHLSQKKVIVEYSSPNIAKPFTVGHLRSTIIGDAIANLLEATGWNVLRDNHLGDWGTQFGKQIYAIKTWGDEASLEASDNPVKDLVALYVKFHDEAEKDPDLEDRAREWFKKLESGDEEARHIWQKCIQWSWKEFQRIYEILGIQHSLEFQDGRGLGESFFEDKMQPVIQELDEKGFLKTGKEGAKLFFFPNDSYPPAMILKKDGTTLYHTRDLATDKYRKDTYQPDLIINEVGSEQSLYFQQLFEMERLLGWFEPHQRLHIGHGMIRFKDKKMSTRKGDVIWLQDVLEEAKKRALALQHTPNDSLAKQVAVGALKWNDLKGAPQRDIIFDWNEILNMKGNSGPYMQYTHARCCSVVLKSGMKTTSIKIDDKQIPTNLEEQRLLRHLIRYPDIVTQAAHSSYPSPHLQLSLRLGSALQHLLPSPLDLGE